jgi:hypothetical protein
MGRAYTARYFRWPSIIARYTTFLEQVAARGHRVPVGNRRLALEVGGPAYARET